MITQNKQNKWKSSLKKTSFLKGTNSIEYNYLFNKKFEISPRKPISIVNTKNFYLEAFNDKHLYFTFKESLKKKVSLEFYEFFRFMGNIHMLNSTIYPYLNHKINVTKIYAIRLRGEKLYAYCLLNNKVKIIKLTSLMSTLGLKYYKNILNFISTATSINKGKYFHIKSHKMIKKANKKIKPNFLRYTRWPIVRFLVGTVMFYTINLLWYKFLNVKFKKEMFNPREAYMKYYHYKRLWNIRFHKWKLKSSIMNFNQPLFQSLFLERQFYENLFKNNRLFKHTPQRGRFVFTYADKKFMKRFFIQSLVKQGKRLRAINWYKDIMSMIKTRLQVSRITNFKAFYFTLMRLKPRYWLRKFKRGRRTEYFPTWIKDKRNKAEAVRLFLKAAKSTAPGAKNVSKQRVIELIILNTFFKKNDAYDALIGYWKTVRRNMHNMNFVPWV